MQICLSSIIIPVYNHLNSIYNNIRIKCDDKFLKKKEIMNIYIVIWFNFEKKMSLFKAVLNNLLLVKFFIYYKCMMFLRLFSIESFTSCIINFIVIWERSSSLTYIIFFLYIIVARLFYTESACILFLFMNYGNYVKII